MNDANVTAPAIDAAIDAPSLNDAPSTPENDAAPVAPVSIAPTVERAMRGLGATIHKYAVGAENPNIAVLNAALAGLVGEHPAIVAARAAITVDIERERANGTAAAFAALRNDPVLKAGFDELFALFVPAQTVARPTSARGTASKNAGKVVARDRVAIEADPAVQYIGADLAAIAAIGHECNVTSILTNGTRRVANLKQEYTVRDNAPDRDEHEACLSLARDTQRLFSVRATLRQNAGIAD